MAQTGPDGHALVYAPGVDNAGTIARRLRDAGVGCVVCADVAAFEAGLFDQSDGLGVVVVTALGVRRGAGAVLARLQAGRAVVVGAPRGAAGAARRRGRAPVGPHDAGDAAHHQPAVRRHHRRAIEARSHQHLLANRSAELQRVALRTP
jgi:hypothetical protein